MQRTISIVVSKRPGLLAQVVAALLREGCKLRSQAVSAVAAPADSSDPALQRFTISVEGPASALRGLPRLLRPFGEVEEAQDAVAAEQPPAVAPEEALRDIADAFPAVADRVLALARSLQPPARAEVLASLGERLGRREYQRSYALGSPLKLEQALRRMVLPAVRQLARAELDGLALRLPSSPFCVAPPAEGSGCDFVVGFARGLLQLSPATAGTLVREARCRAGGHPFCELVFAAS